MMESKTAPRRVRRAALALVCFFAAMLALTYLSRAVSDALKARVAVGYAGSSVLDESVEGTGVWDAGDTRLYPAAYARRVAAVYVRPGDTVAEGDALFAYDVSDLAGGRSVSDRNVRTAKRTLERAEKALAAAPEDAYALLVRESARQALVYARYAYEQAWALQNGGVVRAAFSGTVVKCDLAAGKTAAENVSGLELAPDGLAFTLSVPEAEAARLAVGDALTLFTDGREEPEALTLAAIDAPDASGNVRVVCAGGAEGRTLGEKQEWRVKKVSARYTQTIPLAALRQGGADDYYVLRLTEKETILGTQLAAVKQAVTLLAHDDRLAAIEGGVGERERLITTSTKELKDGDYVVLGDAS